MLRKDNPPDAGMAPSSVRVKFVAAWALLLLAKARLEVLVSRLRSKLRDPSPIQATAISYYRP